MEVSIAVYLSSAISFISLSFISKQVLVVVALEDLDEWKDPLPFEPKKQRISPEPLCQFQPNLQVCHNNNF